MKLIGGVEDQVPVLGELSHQLLRTLEPKPPFDHGEAEDRMVLPDSRLDPERAGIAPRRRAGSFAGLLDQPRDTFLEPPQAADARPCQTIAARSARGQRVSDLAQGPQHRPAIAGLDRAELVPQFSRFPVPGPQFGS